MANYSPALDLAVIVLSLVFLLILKESYIKFSRSFIVFRASIGLICFAACMKVFTYSVSNGSNNPILLYSFRMLYAVSLICLMQLYVAYISDLTIFRRRALLAVTGAADTVMIALVIFVPSLENTLLICYLINVGAMFLCVLINGKLILPRLRYALITVSCISLFIVLFEKTQGHSIFTIFTFLLPLLVVMFMVHSNPYNLKTGALNAASFGTFLKEKRAKNYALAIIQLRDYTFEELPEEYEYAWKRLCAVFRGAILFTPAENTLVLATKTLHDVDNAFHELYLTSRIVFVPSAEKILGLTYYRNLCDGILEQQSWGSVYTCTDADMERLDWKYQLYGELKKIYDRFDLDDPHVLVYCQPIKNTRTDAYDTAEALMRIQLDELGFIYPNDFIPILEQHNLIHRFSMIILNKVCKAVRTLDLSRITVNFSVLELRDRRFLDDFTEVVQSNGTDFSQIGVEFTESTNDADFELLDHAVKYLRKCGCTVYLDDFGTGYSNFDRVLGLNMNVIKFDRSLLLLATNSAKGRYIMQSFSETFEKLGLNILYEGIETDEQESLCLNSNADYLQGFKYSKPVPVEALPGILGA